MLKLAVLLAGLSIGIVGIAPGGGAHPRNYAATGGILTCADGQGGVGPLGGVVGGVVQTLYNVLDPWATDTSGTCFRPNHLVPNLNGDLTVFIQDQFQTNVGGCVSQDANGDGLVCNDGDVRSRFCNSGTVNIHRDLENGDPALGFFVPNAWRFQDSQGVPALPTYVRVNTFLEGSALAGNHPDCGAGADAFGTIGTIGHF